MILQFINNLDQKWLLNLEIITALTWFQSIQNAKGQFISLSL